LPQSSVAVPVLSTTLVGADVCRQEAFRRRSVSGSKTYSVVEVVKAILWFRDVFGRWPTRREFVAFGRLERDLARQFSRRLPRIPVQNSWEHAYGKWDDCLALAIGVAAGGQLPSR